MVLAQCKHALKERIVQLNERSLTSETAREKMISLGKIKEMEKGST